MSRRTAEMAFAYSGNGPVTRSRASTQVGPCSALEMDVAGGNAKRPALGVIAAADALRANMQVSGVHEQRQCEQAEPGPGARRTADLATAQGLECNEGPVYAPIVEDIDLRDARNPQMVTAYIGDIMASLRDRELRRLPRGDYMATQTDINRDMRAILVDWLVEVAEEYRLLSDTFYLAVNYIDRFLSSVNVMRSQLQLVGVACMLVASKYEEIYAPQVDEFCYITDNTYSREEVLDMETRVLDTLEFELTTPTTKTFLRRFVKAAGARSTLEMLASYMAEASLLDYRLVHVPPSRIAAAVVLLASWVMAFHDETPIDPASLWDATTHHYTGYHSADLQGPCEVVFEVYRAVTHSEPLRSAPDSQGARLPAIREKYSTPRFRNVARAVPPADLPDALFHRAPVVASPLRTSRS